jgi:hypothetical protein
MVKGVLASYRWRRRLMWLAVTAAAVAGAVTVALKWPNTAPKAPGPSNVRVRVDNTPPKPVRLNLHNRAASLAVASRFIDTAVARKHIEKSWSLVSPEFRAGFTREQWNTGDVPVVPFPVHEARWKLQYSDVDGVGYTIALLPTKASHQQAQVFMIGLHLLGSGRKRHWVVDNWQPSPMDAIQSVAGGGGGNSGNVLGQATPRLSPLSESRESSAWLLLPVGLLSLIVLVPLAVVTLTWYRERRAERELLHT